MNKFIGLLVALVMLSISAMAQEDDSCSELGVWLWRFEHTGQPSHTNLGRTISSIGGKRIYVKVADGGYNATNWTTLVDEELVQEYLNEGVSPWAWSYNYEGNVEAQAKALYFAAKTGYQGYVIDIEIEFNGEDETLEALMKAFYEERERAIADGYASEDFPLYVTTWGNPSYHNYRIDIIDKYVDGYMPQTYIEEWAGDHLTMIENCIEESRLDYESLGATKPIHNILSTAQQILTPEEITHFFELSGPEASLWRVPGGGVSQTVWDRWRDVNWEINFCDTVNTEDQSQQGTYVYPNPADNFISVAGLDQQNVSIEIYNQAGVKLVQDILQVDMINVSNFAPGLYHLVLNLDGEHYHHRFIKL